MLGVNSRTRTVLLDVDGCLTDGKVIFNQDGTSARAFHARDRVAIRRMSALGWEIHIVTMSDWIGTRLWAARLPVILHQASQKTPDEIRKITRRRPFYACGDDPVDYDMLCMAERAFAPADADPRLRNMVEGLEVLPMGGGEGIVWEILDRIGVPNK